MNLSVLALVSVCTLASASTRTLGPAEGIERTVSIDAGACGRSLAVKSQVSGGAYAASVAWIAECTVEAEPGAAEKVLQSTTVETGEGNVRFQGTATQYHFSVSVQPRNSFRPDKDQMAADAQSAIEGFLNRAIPGRSYVVTAIRAAK